MTAAPAAAPAAAAPTPEASAAPVAEPAAAPSAAPASPSPVVSAAPAREHQQTLVGAGTWSAPQAVTTGRPVEVAGQFHAALVGRAVRLQRKTPAGRWVTAATAHVRKDGTFAISWRTRAARNHDLRLVLLAVRGSAHTTVPADGALANASTPVRVTVLGQTRASWFGPGFYGRKTACGLVLRKRTEGVAHRTLPCGSQVEIRLAGKSVVLPVIDRGPFANKADFDLTKNAADQIGLGGVAAIEYVERQDLPRISTPHRAPALRR
jgi:rare lipoprotein A